MIAKQNFEIHSLNVLWYLNEDNNPMMIPNIYDNSEVVRVYGNSINEYQDYPIEDPITYCPNIGLVLFKTQNDAARFMSIIESESGSEIVIENSFQASINSTANKEYPSWGIKDGIYCYDAFDEDLPQWHWVTELRYLNEEMLIKKPIQIPSHLESKFATYLSQFQLEVNHNFENERLLFEVYSEDGKTYVNHFFVHLNNTNVDAILFTRICHFPIFMNKRCAALWRLKYENGMINPGLQLYQKQSKAQAKREVDLEKQRRKELVLKIGKMCGEYAYSHLQDIINFGKTQFNKYQKKKKGE